jgi:PPOX class probable FMN-dependent enzyme
MTLYTWRGEERAIMVTTIDDLCTLREFYAEPSERALKKQLPALDRHCRAFIALSPFVVIASASAEGGVDASPKGDAPGFVRVLDDQTLVIPDRPGNNRVDTLGNILSNAHVGLLFMVPGMNETLRVNGTAQISTDPDLLAPLAVRGKTPATCIVVHVQEAFLHCAKALIRSDLWNPEKHIDRSTFPSLGRVLADQITGLDPESTEQSIEEAYRTRLY